MAIETLYTAHAVSTGGRNGHTQNESGIVSFDLSVPGSMGGAGKEGTTTPEDLFAAGYAACFGGAVDFQSKLLKLVPSSLEIHCAVSIGKVEAGGFGLGVEMEAKVGGLSQEDAEKIVQAGHEFCPYSRAIKGNVDVALKVTVV
jgi:osmotically inducible protein OsmC